MEIVKLLGMNRDLGKPKDWDEARDGECGTLPVFAEVVGGHVRMTSAWKPDAEELAALNAGSAVAMTVLGTVHPPIMVGVFELAEYTRQASYVEQPSPGALVAVPDLDKDCPILALAPAEYTDWEKRVWRRGVVDAETRREVQAAVRQSQGRTVSQGATDLAATDQPVNDLLAVLCGDGGHFRVEHGTAEAARKGLARVQHMMQTLAEHGLL